MVLIVVYQVHSILHLYSRMNSRSSSTPICLPSMQFRLKAAYRIQGTSNNAIYFKYYQSFRLLGYSFLRGLVSWEHLNNVGGARHDAIPLYTIMPSMQPEQKPVALYLYTKSFRPDSLHTEVRTSALMTSVTSTSSPSPSSSNV